MLTFAELCCDDSHRRRNVGAVIHSKFNKINSIFAFISILLLQPSEQLTGCFDIICCATGYTTEWRGGRSSNSYSSHSRAKNKIVFQFKCEISARRLRKLRKRSLRRPGSRAGWTLRQQRKITYLWTGSEWHSVDAKSDNALLCAHSLTHSLVSAHKIRKQF